MVNVTRERYLNLESELGHISSRSDYRNLKHAVIMADGATIITGIPKYISVASALKLTQRSTEELRHLYQNEIHEINHHLFAVRSSIAPHLPAPFNMRMASDTSPEKNIDDFARSFSEIMNNDGLNGKRSIKLVILYPLNIAVINTWRKQNDIYAGRLIDKLRAHETDPMLKAAISIIDIPIR